MLYFKWKEDGGFSTPGRPSALTSALTFNSTPAASTTLTSPAIELTLGSGGDGGSSGGGGGGDEYKWAKKLKTLVDMGFSEDQAKQALEETNGNDREALMKLIDA